ncbi:unnamed protein product [Cuscuta europaea]|uniref:UPF3 domain-containing protein n=1 Tax=Cuscuta europaea TaxID=41803 RepID=A0A9P0Z166_CUSEU|nr:unnamed protein product [Cuscuta europaea]
MKGPLDRTKIVLRHLPPALTQSALFEQIDSRFSGRYNWSSFRPGKTSQKHQTYSRAYIDFNTPEDVIEFAEFFSGHVFVNEKGSQFKTIVEYAPSQRVPRHSSKKDGREGTILKDPDYLEFLEYLGKPIENLPSAEIQLERKEAERAGAPKDAPIITPLMDYVRQKRAAKSGARRVSNGKPFRRVGGTSAGSPSSIASKRGSERRRNSTKMYVQRDSSKFESAKDRAYILVRKHDDKQLFDKSDTSASAAQEEGGPVLDDSGKKRILLLKGKEKEISNVLFAPSVQQSVVPLVKNSVSSYASRPNQRREASGRIIRSILLKDARQNQSPSASQTELQIQDNDKRPPRAPQSTQLSQKDCNGSPVDKFAGSDSHNVHMERRTRSRDRPDRGVWTPLRRHDHSQANEEYSLSSASQSTQVQDFAGGSAMEAKSDGHGLSTRSGEFKSTGGGRSSHPVDNNGTYRYAGRRGPAYNTKDTDNTAYGEGRPSRRGGPGYVAHEKQVWVQKSSSGS